MSQTERSAVLKAERGPWLGALGAGLLCLVSAALYLRMTPERLVGWIGPDPADPVFNLYLLRWGAHQASLGFPAFWDANFFFPMKGVVALSDHMLGPSLAFGAAQALGATPALGYNLLLLSSFALGGAALFWIGRASGLSVGAATVAAFGYSFALTRWQELSHLQILLSQWLPLTLWTFDRLLARRTRLAAVYFLLAYSLNLLGGTYLAYMVHLGLATVLGVRFATEGRKPLSRESLRILVPTGCVAAAISAAVFVPYLRLREQLHVEARLRELDDLRLSLSSLLTSTGWPLYADLFPDELRRRPSLWLGLVPLVLFVVALGRPFGRLREAWRRLAPRRRALAVGALLACAAALVVADFATAGLEIDVPVDWKVARRLYRVCGLTFLTGCFALRSLYRSSGATRSSATPWWRALLWIGGVSAFAAHPIGYFLLREILPGFGSMRVAGRLFLLAAPAFFLAMGLGVDRLQSFASARRPALARAVPLVVLALLAIEMTPRSRLVKWEKLAAERAFPPAVRWLAEQNNVGATLELPLLPYWKEARRMYYSTLHFRPMVNGYSGYVPPSYIRVQRRLAEFPTNETLSWLKDLGVTHLVLHRGDYPRWLRRTVDEWRQSAAQFSPVGAQTQFAEGDTFVLKLELAPAPAAEAPTGRSAGVN